MQPRFLARNRIGHGNLRRKVEKCEEIISVLDVCWKPNQTVWRMHRNRLI